MRYLLLILCLLIHITFLGCKTEYGRAVNPAFYYWKNKLEISSLEQAYLEKLNARKIYLRFFDVDWNPIRQQSVPISSISLDPERIQSAEVIPTVHIHSRILSAIPEEQIAMLANQIYSKIIRIAGQVAFREIQLDCNWKPEDQEVYFQLISNIKNLFADKDVSISATIRLHHIKYYLDTGVPPVEKGMLMVYHSENDIDLNEKNAILDADKAEEYLENIEQYPLKLDIALPLFSWGMVIRGEKTTHLLDHLHISQLENSRRFHFFDSESIKVLENCYFNGYYLRKDDIIRIKSIPVELLFDTAEMLAPLIPNDSLNVSFYHLDTPTIFRYTTENLETICRMFN